MNIWTITMVLLALVSPISYARSMIKGQAKPHKVTRLIVWLVSITALLGVVGSSNLAGILFAGIFLARATFLFGMSLKYGVGGSTRLDKICLVGGIAALSTYALTGNGLYAILLGILTDIIAFVPTFVKTWHQPETEDPTYFFIEMIAAICGILAVGEIRVDILFPIYFTVCNILLLIFIYRKKLPFRLTVTKAPA